MTLLIACLLMAYLLIAVLDLNCGFYVLATLVWIYIYFIKVTEIFLSK